MSKKKHHLIRYFWEYKDVDGIMLPDWKTKKVVIKNVRRYQNCQHKLIRLSRVAYMYMLFLTELMDEEDNFFTHTSKTRTDFINYVNANCQITWTDHAVKKAFGQLVSQGLIISYGKRIDYTVNPIYFYKGDEDERRSLIANLINQANNPSKGSNIKTALAV